MDSNSVSQFRLIVEPVWSWPIVACAVIGMLALVLLTYPQRIQHLSRGWRRILLTLRLLTVLVLVFAMFRPAIERTETDKKAAVLAIMTDASKSMGTKDGPNNSSRREALAKTLKDSWENLTKLGEEIEVRFYDFGDSLDPYEQPEPGTEALAEMTAIGNAMESVVRDAQNKRVIGMVLMSDGAHRARPPMDLDPRTTAARLGDRQIPVQTIAYGNTSISDTSLDLAIEELVVDPVVFVKKVAPIDVKVRLQGAQGRNVTVRVLLEDRNGIGRLKGGELRVPTASNGSRPSTIIQTSKNVDVIQLNDLSFVPQVPGEFKLAVEVVPLNGEIKLKNNRVETLISVRKGGVTVAYFDRFRPEIRSVRLLNNANEIQLDSEIVRGALTGKAANLDPAKFQPGKYDVYILGDVPATAYTKPVLAEIQKRVQDNGAGLLMMGGIRSFGPGGFAATPLEDLLPVALNKTDVEAGNAISPDLHHLQDLKMLPTDKGYQHFVMQLDPGSENKNRTAWDRLPPLAGANKLEIKNDFIEVLATSDGTEAGIPLLLSTEFGRGRVMSFAADSTYLWFQNGFKDETIRFWRQLIMWLARKEEDRDKPVWVRVEPRRYAQGAIVNFEFGARDDKGIPIDDVQFTVEVENPEKNTQSVAVQKRAMLGSATYRDTLIPGDYWVKVVAKKNGKRYGIADTRFIVEARDLELDNPAADHNLLKEISSRTGGRHIPPEQFNDYLATMLKDGIPGLEETLIRRTPLWDNWFLLVLFIGLMTTEWVIRKLRGLV